MNNFDKQFNETLLRDVQENNLTVITEDYIGDITNRRCLEHVVIPEGITEIGDYVFHDINIIDVQLPSSLVKLGQYAFAECYKLQKIDLPANLKTIDNNAFFSSGITSITIPDSVEYIGDDVFSFCDYLTSVTIGKNARIDTDGLRRSPFYACSQIVEFIVHPENMNYTAINRLLFSKDGTTLLASAVGSDKLIIPEGTKKIAWGTCFGQTEELKPGKTGFTELEIPGTVEEISDETFVNCPHLKTVTFKSGITTIGQFIENEYRDIKDETFSKCQNLETINFPDSLTEIGDNMFNYCKNLKSVKIPDSVKRIGKYSFFECNAELYDVTTIPGIVMVDGWVVNFTKHCPEHLDLSNVRGIVDGALDYCMVVRSIKLPPHVDPEKFSIKNIHNPLAKD